MADTALPETSVTNATVFVNAAPTPNAPRTFVTGLLRPLKGEHQLWMVLIPLPSPHSATRPARRLILRQRLLRVMIRHYQPDIVWDPTTFGRGHGMLGGWISWL